MRLGELKQKLDAVIQTNKTIKPEITGILNNQRFLVKNYAELLHILRALTTNGVNANNDILTTLAESYGNSASEVEISPQHQQALNTLVTAVNSKLPTFYEFLTARVKDQSPNTINIKLPEKKLKPQELAEVAIRLQRLFKELTIEPCEFEFVGFDSGSDWIEIAISGSLLVYYATMGLVELAAKICNLRTAYYESEIKKAEFEKFKRFAGTKKGYDDFVDHAVDEDKNVGLEEVYVNLKVETPESKTKLKIALDGIVKEIGIGLEFHPSLNPPEEITETGGKVILDYTNVRKRIAQETNKTELIENSKEKIEGDKEE